MSNATYEKMKSMHLSAMAQAYQQQVADPQTERLSFEERLAMVQESASKWPGVRAEPFDGLITQFVRAKGGKAMVRGLRAVTDFDYEFQLAGMNGKLAPEVESVFLTPHSDYQFVSSTFMREIALLGGDVKPFVSPHVWTQLMAKKEGGTKP